MRLFQLAPLLLPLAAGAVPAEADFEAVITSAHCHVVATDNYSGSALSGSFAFAVNDDGDLDVDYSVSGLDTGSHPFHVHTYGDIWNKDGTSTGGMLRRAARGGGEGGGRA